jgi:hypothetical protein
MDKPSTDGRQTRIINRPSIGRRTVAASRLSSYCRSDQIRSFTPHYRAWVVKGGQLAACSHLVQRIQNLTRSDTNQ